MKNEVNTFLGVQPLYALTEYEKEFEVIYNDDGELILLSNKIFESEEDDNIPKFEYRYIVRCIDMYAFDGRTEIIIETFMCPLAEYINKNQLNSVMNGYDDSEYIYRYYTDMASSCLLPNFGTEYISYKTEDVSPDENGNFWYDYYYNILDNKDVVNKLNTAATVLYNIDRMRGFNLDRVWNMLGSTGWDLLKTLLNGTDWVKTSIDRCRQEI